MYVGQCGVSLENLCPPRQGSSSAEEEKFFFFFLGRRNIILTSAPPDTSLFISKRRILFLSPWKKKSFFTVSIFVEQCGVSLRNLCPPRHEPLHQEKKNFFPFSSEEEILFYFFFVCRKLWWLIRKLLPTQTWASSSVEEEFFIRKSLPTQECVSRLSLIRRIFILFVYKKKFLPAEKGGCMNYVNPTAAKIT